MENKTSKTVGCNFGGLGTLLTVAFVVLKLCGVISWSWVWVLSPLWISFGLGLVVFIITIIVGVIIHKTR